MEKARGTYMRKQRKFYLPMTAMFASHTNERGKVIVHSLDFDLVASGDTFDSAIEKLRISVKVYIEHGIMNNLTDLIPCPAPDQYWPKNERQDVELLPPIDVDESRMFILKTMAVPNNAPGSLASVAH